MAEEDATAYWQSRYAERDQIWSGHANAALVSAVSGLAPGSALDLGCGEGGDSVWLAERGWQVTGVDIAPNAVERARAAAAARGLGDQITWLVEDLSTWTPPAHFDLVSACFLHTVIDFPRAEVLRRGAASVAPGGHLLVVGHAEAPPWSRHEHEHNFLDPDEEIAALDLEPGWDTVIAEVSTRQATGPGGETGTLSDSVVLLRHR